MKKLTKIRLINWHYFSNETIEVKNNILLTGQNATGKSTILDAITFVVTAGDTQFNVAANENGKRDLKGYVKCKVSRTDREYLREGDITGHVALEFYDTVRDTYFTVGTVIDAFGDLLPAKYLFYQTFEKLSDSFFVSDDGIILSTADFKKHNQQMEVFLTKKEAKRAFRITFGNLNDDFFRLIHKALAFKPIADVKEFIYDHLLEEKQIDVENIRDSIRSYKELENTLKVIKQKITDLHEIEGIYKDIKSNEDAKNFYSYILQLFEEKAIKLEVDELKVKKVQVNEQKEAKALEIKRIESEIEALDERSRELYRLLSTNEEFVQNEYIDKQIIKTRTTIDELSLLEKEYLARASYVKDAVRSVRKLFDSEALKRLANVSLNNVHTDLVDQTKLTLIDIDSQLTTEYDKLVASKNGFEREKQELLKEINEISQTLRGLENRTLRYNPMVMALKAELEAGLKQMYGYDVSVYILAELLEITDPRWADTIEVYLNRRRFNLIIEPRYYDAALQIYNRVKSHRNIHGVGLVNTKKISSYTSCQPRSLATIITSENVDAKRYINYLVGNVIMCDDVTELENYQAAITNEGMLYQGYVVSALNYNGVEKPFIGKDATEKQLQQYTQHALSKKNEYIAVNKEIEHLVELINAYNSFDLKGIIKDINISARVREQKDILSDVLEQKKRSDRLTSNELQQDYDKVLATIKRYNESKSKLLELGGTYKAQIEQIDTTIAQLNDRLAAIDAELTEIKLANLSIEREASKAIDEALAKSKDVKRHQQDYARLVAVQEDNMRNLGNRLAHLQYQYNTKYNTIYGVGVSEMGAFLKELNKLEKSEIITYEQKVRSAREDAELLFREDFLSKLRNYIMSAEDEIKKINETLSSIRFGEDSYEFVFPKSKEFSIFYDMVTSDFSSSESGLLALDFEMKYNEQLEELFASLAQDELNSNGALSRFTDYRTYMDYDIKIYNRVTDTETLYSQVFKEKSGGETQVPFYVAIIASFVRIYTRNNKSNNDSIGLILFDEVFDKMDGRRMKSMMQFINSMPIQILLACPSSRLKDLAPYTETTIVTLRNGEQAQILNLLSKDVVEGNV